MRRQRPQHLTTDAPRDWPWQRGALVVGVLIALLVGGGVAFAIARSADDPSVAAADTSSTTTTTATDHVVVDDHHAPAAALGHDRVRRRRAHPLGRVEGRRHRRRLRLLAHAGADPTAALRRRPGDLPPRGHPRPARGRPVELPAVPGADGAGDGPGRGRLRRLLGGVEPRPRLRGAGRGGDARRARRGRSGPRRDGTVAGGGQPARRATTSTASPSPSCPTPTGSTASCGRPARSGSSTRSTRR